jgi:hypothetical protein
MVVPKLTQKVYRVAARKVWISYHVIILSPAVTSNQYFLYIHVHLDEISSTSCYKERLNF